MKKCSSFVKVCVVSSVQCNRNLSLVTRDSQLYLFPGPCSSRTKKIYPSTKKKKKKNTHKLNLSFVEKIVKVVCLLNVTCFI